MFRRVTVAALVLMASAAAAATARADSYYVTGTGDSALATCRPISGFDGFSTCDSVRAAVTAANANPNNEDVVFLQVEGNYAVTTPLEVTDDLTLFGRGPRTTTLRGAGTARVLTVGVGVDMQIYRVAIAGGRSAQAQGGNILNQGNLTLINSRVTDGQAPLGGGGIASVGPGQLSLLNSLVDNNTSVGLNGGLGGGILVRGAAGGGVDTTIINSTIALNSVTGEIAQGGGLAVTGANNDTLLQSVTVARNATSSAPGSGAGIYLATGNVASIDSSLVDSNTAVRSQPSNCSSTGTFSEDPGRPYNREEANTCPFEVHGGASGVSADLVDLGGDTLVMDISPTGGAKGAVDQCVIPTDQRTAQRPATGCDAGALQQGATAPEIDSEPFPQPDDGVGPTPTATPTPPAPVAQTPVPTPVTPVPTPVAGTTVVAQPQGTVLVKIPPSKKFVALPAGAPIPVGASFDTRKGKVEITAIPKPGAPPEKATFYEGIFKLGQSSGVTNLTLTEPLAACPKRGGHAAAKKPKKRHLWGEGEGHFRTTGRLSSATVRGTKWFVEDSCAGTLTRVTQGSVLVRDFVLKRNKIVRAGGRYTARPKR